MRLSDLLKDMGETANYEIYREKEFDVFARITTRIDKYRCIFLADKKYIPMIPEKTAMIILTKELSVELAGREEGICICENPKAVYFRLLNHTASQQKPVFQTKIGKGCEISENAYIAPNNVILGEGVRVEAFACIYEGSEIGDNCIIRSGARIGIQDYNYYQENGELKQLIHQGKTVIKNNVDVGYNSVIGRGLYEYGQTYIGEYCKIACNASIGHDDMIGRETMIMSNVALGGYTTIGERARISMGAIVKNSLKIGEDSHIEMGAVVIRDVDKAVSVFGNPARKVISP